MKTINVDSGHTMHIQEIPKSAMPAGFEHVDNYNKFYVVRNWDKDGVVFFYLAKGHKDSAREIVVWYRNGKFWHSFGLNFRDAIEGAQRDGWLYAE